LQRYLIHEKAKVPFGGGDDATLLFPRDRGVKELHGDPTVGPRPKVWTRGQKWKM